MNVSSQLFECLHRLESRVVLGDSLERESEEIDCRSESLDDLVAEAPPRFVHRDETGELAIERESPNRENSPILLRRETEQLEIVVRLGAEVREGCPGHQRSSYRGREMIDRHVERGATNTGGKRC